MGAKDPYRSVEAFYDRRAREATHELDAGRGVYHDIPAAITAHLEWMEEQLAQVCADAFSGTVLDAGCGNGNVLVRVLPKTAVARFVGTDISRGMLVRAQERTRGEAAVHGFVQGNVITLPFRTASFDGVACLEVLVHLPSNEAIVDTLRELSRVLKPNGTLVITMLTNVLSLRGGFARLVLRPLRRNEPDLLGLRSSLWLLRQLRAEGFRVDWYRGWDRPIVNKTHLYWLNWPLGLVDRLHRALSRVFPSLHLLRDRIVFRCVKSPESLRRG